VNKRYLILRCPAVYQIEVKLNAVVIIKYILGVLCNLSTSGKSYPHIFAP